MSQLASAVRSLGSSPAATFRSALSAASAAMGHPHLPHNQAAIREEGSPASTSPRLAADFSSANTADLLMRREVPREMHPTLQLMRRRYAEGTVPGLRTDGAKLGLVVEGGGMRGGSVTVCPVSRMLLSHLARMHPFPTWMTDQSVLKHAASLSPLTCVLSLRSLSLQAW